MKKIIIPIIITILTLISITIAYNYKKFGNNEIFYKLNKYVCLDFKEDIFYYYYNNTEYLEEDYILEIEDNNWKYIYHNEDLYIRKKDYKDAKKYYDNDKNYSYYLNIEEEYTSTTYPIDIYNDEIQKIYNMNNIINKDKLKFEDIEKHGSLTKKSKDGKITGIISLAYVKNNWYYRTEIMNDNDEEYVVKLPDTLIKRLNDMTLNN